MTCPFIPLEFNVVVEINVEEKIGSIILAQSTQDANKLAAEEGIIAALSPHAFTYADWPEGARKAEIGDRVLIAKFGGIQRDRDGRSYKIVKDKDIIAIVEPASSPLSIAA